MYKLMNKYIPVVLISLTLSALGYIIDARLPENWDKVLWSIMFGIYLLINLVFSVLISYLYESTYMDILTKLKNRRYFYLKLSKELSKVEKKKSCISFLMIDIDNFKSINDSYGHIAGDKVLKQMADIFKKNIRSSDIVARWGGEEFAVILPQTESEEAVKIAERIRAAVQNSEFNCNTAFCKITVSIGAASVRERTGVDSLVNLADKALYKAKKKKNLVCAA